jgi:hypothetical protein
MFDINYYCYYKLHTYIRWRTIWRTMRITYNDIFWFDVYLIRAGVLRRKDDNPMCLCMCECVCVCVCVCVWVYIYIFTFIIIIFLYIKSLLLRSIPNVHSKTRDQSVISCRLIFSRHNSWNHRYRGICCIYSLFFPQQTVRRRCVIKFYEKTCNDEKKDSINNNCL